MNTVKRVLLLGAGGWAREHWIDIVWPDFRDKVEIVGLVDMNEKALLSSGAVLGLSEEVLFTDMDKAFSATNADFCVIVLPPHAHRIAVEKATRYNLPILSEKPIADSYDDVKAIYTAVSKKKLKMAVIQNYRYEAPIMTLKKVLESKKLGRIDYIVARYASDYRQPGSWDVGSVYEMEHPLLVEGSIHHLDMIRNLSGSDCKTIQCTSWNPDWSNFKDNANAMVMMEMDNGVKAIYEGSSLAAGTINRWHQEYYRVECEKGSVVVDRGDRIVRVYTRDEDGKQTIEEIPPVSELASGHHQILTEFLRWLDGGLAPETVLDDNIRSAVMVFAAIKSAEENKQQIPRNFLPQL
ncbi:Gfo/Idh/MocA family oxidoreductase [Candidatus Saccharibacteria bacterium]|nr:Gfo/Idh/MocA family oxidoreductase [Candidatus Saccharibacteria bacterium]